MAPLMLTPRQRLELEYLASHNPAAKERCRAQALLWLDEGETPEQVAESAPRQPPDGLQLGGPVPRPSRGST